MSTLLELTVGRWAEVIKENEQDKDLITPEQLKSWQEFEKRTTGRLKSIITNYDGETLSATDKDWLQELSTTIDRSKRVTREELEAQKAARDEAERVRLQEEADRKAAEELKAKKVESTKGRLLDMLGS